MIYPNYLLSKLQCLASAAGIKDPLIIYKVSVAEGLLHAPLILMSLHRAPLALALYHLLGNQPRRMGTNHHDVGMIAWAQIASLSDLEQLGRLMSHELYQSLDAEHTLVYQFQHSYERELHHRHS